MYQRVEHPSREIKALIGNAKSSTGRNWARPANIPPIFPAQADLNCTGTMTLSGSLPRAAKAEAKMPAAVSDWRKWPVRPSSRITILAWVVYLYTL